MNIFHKLNGTEGNPTGQSFKEKMYLTNINSMLGLNIRICNYQEFKLLHGIAALASILFSQVACGGSSSDISSSCKHML